MGSGGEAEYLEILRKLNDEVLGVRGELMRVRASNVGALVSCIERVVCTGSDELGPEGVSLLERCSHFRGWYVQVWDLKKCPY